ncbi:hypothetical protein T02_9255 [Trichinella nativa]|uniref:Uncharacterized protein n=1 Tax=Trichinella nativa TaxID=6335 RepID=A0A0V1LND0_9BILA|nr:hypothetical protein T02_9255 [Trichinella nativa]
MEKLTNFAYHLQVVKKVSKIYSNSLDMMRHRDACINFHAYDKWNDSALFYATSTGLSKSKHQQQQLLCSLSLSVWNLIITVESCRW